MKNFVLAVFFLFPVLLQAYDEEILFENEQIGIYRWKLMPGESIGKHIDVNPQVVIAIQGGTIMRLGEDGSISHVILPTGKAVFQEIDSELHDGINISENPIEAILIDLITK